ncbi:hypothetical protein ZHAS_00000355 [Anopheles sinensis]|uniref:Uncharacterized protein n=1 Tax=Anopheles sinensis TaxID=74873 RepID=A0A084VA44_ANOSI|nr:hypothetical protein ZHAS_00000355 [Anopheles sinensis]
MGPWIYERKTNLGPYPEAVEVDAWINVLGVSAFMGRQKSRPTMTNLVVTQEEEYVDE